jgi:phytoene dehydrogenase-like protein
MSNKKIVIIGAGFSGSTAAFFLSKKGFDVTVLESESHEVIGNINGLLKNGSL